jgi:hypothetical protein
MNRRDRVCIGLFGLAAVLGCADGRHDEPSSQPLRPPPIPTSPASPLLKHEPVDVEPVFVRITELGGLIEGDLTRPREPLRVTFDGKTIGDDALEAVATLTTLEELNLNRCKGITDAGLTHLRRLPRLKRLRLNDAGVGDEALARLAELPSLEGLWLVRCPVTDAGLRHVGRLTNLRELHLGGTQITEHGLAALGSLSELRVLGLASVRTTDVAVEHLAHFKQLESLRPGTSEMSDKAKARLVDALPKWKAGKEWAKKKARPNG